MKTNILLIQVDQMHANALSIVGNPNVKTPHLDALAGQGCLFEHAVCQQPLCVPSRTSMLAGQYPSSTQELGNDGLVRGTLRTLPQVLADAGYETAAFGKFHVPGLDRRQFAFDTAAPTMDEPEREIPAGNSYRRYMEERGLPFGTDQLHGAAPQVFSSHSSEDMHVIHRKSCMSDIPEEHSLEPWTTNRCIDFLRNRKEGAAPFFIWQTYDRPHNPTCLPEDWHQRIRPGDLKLPPELTPEQVENLTPYLRHCLENLHSIHSFGEEVFRFILATYYKLIEYLDHHIGRLLKELETLGLDERTTIVFTSDHGDMAGWWGCYNKAQSVCADALTRVPLILRPAPCLGKARTAPVSAPVELVDLFPTLCSLAGVAIPEEVEGRDLRPLLLEGEVPDDSRPVFSEAMSRKMITWEGWKLVMHISDDAETMLIDMTRDPDGTNNLAGDPALQSQRIRLKQRLIQFLAERHYGRFTPEDVKEMDLYVGHTPAWPGKVIGNLQGLYSLRAGVVMREAEGLLLVHFAEQRSYRFAPGGWEGRTLSDALDWDADMVEDMLDRILRELMKQCRSIAPFESLNR